ncbi:transcription antitermination factor NusB [Pleomorphovibrio marinus]|uniref:transcription antitermination factor NusB n=1 Tax=Pleomorphovibrio marinus TaxID=2164132 RepID=UPI000E0AD67D|nr:transcription antitermination factor NusB [Pleomorphovibrio marinus]
MLNRRILRVKAFQTLYAFQQCKASNQNLAYDWIKAQFLPDLNSMEVQDKVKLRKEAEQCIRLFDAQLEGNPHEDGEHSPKINNMAKAALVQFKKQNEKDLEFLSNNMVTAAERIPSLYLLSIAILIGFGEHLEKELDKRKKLGNKGNSLAGESNLAKNKVLVFLKEKSPIEQEFVRHHVFREEIADEIRQWFREHVKSQEDYLEYSKNPSPSWEDDMEILQTLLKKVVFKNDTILSFFQEKDINWSENRPVVRSLALKVLKNLDGEGLPSEEFLPELAINWEDDKEFFQNIFNLSVRSEKEFSGLIAEKAKNWDIERIAQTDKVILTMALTEMVNFPSIPVKVTINEFIDISKTYSTPKSKQFVNGLLDVLAKELTDSGKIRKSGRGLIDNK